MFPSRRSRAIIRDFAADQCERLAGGRPGGGMAVACGVVAESSRNAGPWNPTIEHAHRRSQYTYDHRLRRAVYETKDITIALAAGVPRSTAAGWLRTPPPEVVTLEVFDMPRAEVELTVIALKRKASAISALCRVLLALIRAAGLDLSARRLPDEARDALVRAITRARPWFPLHTILRILRLPASTYHAWASDAARCTADESRPCVRRTPNQLTPGEVTAIREMVTSPTYRHVPTGRLALLAQRLGQVVAAPSTWYRLIKNHGWRRPRLRVHPESPKLGVRASRPNEVWHVDTTLIRLLDGSKAYLHAVIDNYSRKILSWCVDASFHVTNCAKVLIEAATAADLLRPPMTVVDGGIENYNRAVDQMVSEGVIRRLRAQSIDLRPSNSMIEAFWRSLKHHWLYLNTLDTVTAVERLAGFFIHEHNSVLPHPAFQGQTPDEMYLGTGIHVPAELATAKANTRVARLAANRTASCSSCPRSAPAALIGDSSAP